MSTRAQIGFYNTWQDLKAGNLPEAVIYQHNDGYPTGLHGVVPKLTELVPELVEQRGSYDVEYLAAQLLYHFIASFDQGQSGLGFGISRTLHYDTRFYYAVVPEGVYVYDAREMEHFSDIGGGEMFFTAWVDPERRRKVENEISDLQSQLAKKAEELEGLKRKKVGK